MTADVPLIAGAYMSPQGELPGRSQPAGYWKVAIACAPVIEGAEQPDTHIEPSLHASAGRTRHPPSSAST